jgi:hypothetical protein
MLIEVLNATTDVYSNLYSFRTLVAIYRAEPTLSDSHSEILVGLLLRALNPGTQGSEGSKLGQIQDSALLYTGYLIIFLAERNQIKQMDLITILKVCGKRAIASQLPSCVKSFIIPIAYMFMKEPEPHKLLGIFD